jgi:uncharacterized protein YchJ
MSSSNLTVPQLEVLGALASGSSVTAAARAAGLHRTTIHNWARVIPNFRILLHDARNSRADAVQEKLYDLSDAAIDALHSILNDTTASTSQRLKAATLVLNSASARPALLPSGQITSEEYDAISDDIFDVEANGGEENEDAPEMSHTLEPQPEPSVAAESSPQIHHNSSLFITKDEITPPATETAPSPPPIPRGSPCPCGSGHKFKRCCGRNAPPVLTAAA